MTEGFVSALKKLQLIAPDFIFSRAIQVIFNLNFYCHFVCLHLPPSMHILSFRGCYCRTASSVCLLGCFFYVLASVAHLLSFPRICNTRVRRTRCPGAFGRSHSWAVVPRQQRHLFGSGESLRADRGAEKTFCLSHLVVFMFGEEESFISPELTFCQTFRRAYQNI